MPISPEYPRVPPSAVRLSFRPIATNHARVSRMYSCTVCVVRYHAQQTTSSHPLCDGYRTLHSNHAMLVQARLQARIGGSDKLMLDGDTFYGISVGGRGVFTNGYKHGYTYAGQCRDGYACGLGVATWSSGRKEYAEHGPDGKYDGRRLVHWADGDTDYRLYERGEEKDYAFVFADGNCMYNGEACALDDPRLLALIALVAPVEVRPAARAPHPLLGPPLAPKQSSDADGSAGSFCTRRFMRTPWPPRCTPTPPSSLVAVRHNPRPAALQRTTTQ